MSHERIVLVIETRKLFEIMGGYFQGFKLLQPGIIGMLEMNSCWLKKSQAEKDPRFKQFIGYISVVNHKGEIFTYRRAEKDTHYEEKRLQGKWSIGIGGHVERSDVGESEIILPAAKREIREEIFIYGQIRSLGFIGGINDDRDEVGAVHFGLWIRLAITGFVEPKSKEIAQGSMKTFSEIWEIFQISQMEGWSKICFPFYNLCR